RMLSMPWWRVQRVVVIPRPLQPAARNRRVGQCALSKRERNPGPLNRPLLQSAHEWHRRAGARRRSEFRRLDEDECRENKRRKTRCVPHPDLTETERDLVCCCKKAHARSIGLAQADGREVNPDVLV